MNNTSIKENIEVPEDILKNPDLKKLYQDELNNINNLEKNLKEFVSIRKEINLKRNKIRNTEGMRYTTRRIQHLMGRKPSKKIQDRIRELLALRDTYHLGPKQLRDVRKEIERSSDAIFKYRVQLDITDTEKMQAEINRLKRVLKKEEDKYQRIITGELRTVENKIRSPSRTYRGSKKLSYEDAKEDEKERHKARKDVLNDRLDKKLKEIEKAIDAEFEKLSKNRKKEIRSLKKIRADNIKRHKKNPEKFDDDFLDWNEKDYKDSIDRLRKHSKKNKKKLETREKNLNDKATAEFDKDWEKELAKHKANKDKIKKGRGLAGSDRDKRKEDIITHYEDLDKEIREVEKVFDKYEDEDRQDRARRLRVRIKKALRQLKSDKEVEFNIKRLRKGLRNQVLVLVKRKLEIQIANDEGYNWDDYNEALRQLVILEKEHQKYVDGKGKYDPEKIQAKIDQAEDTYQSSKKKEREILKSNAEAVRKYKRQIRELKSKLKLLEQVLKRMLPKNFLKKSNKKIEAAIESELIQKWKETALLELEDILNNIEFLMRAGKLSGKEAKEFEKLFNHYRNRYGIKGNKLLLTKFFKSPARSGTSKPNPKKKKKVRSREFKFKNVMYDDMLDFLWKEPEVTGDYDLLYKRYIKDKMAMFSGKRPGSLGVNREITKLLASYDIKTLDDYDKLKKADPKLRSEIDKEIESRISKTDAANAMDEVNDELLGMLRKHGYNLEDEENENNIVDVTAGSIYRGEHAIRDLPVPVQREVKRMIKKEMSDQPFFDRRYERYLKSVLDATRAKDRDKVKAELEDEFNAILKKKGYNKGNDKKQTSITVGQIRRGEKTVYDLPEPVRNEVKEKMKAIYNEVWGKVRDHHIDTVFPHIRKLWVKKLDELHELVEDMHKLDRVDDTVYKDLYEEISVLHYSFIVYRHKLKIISLRNKQARARSIGKEEHKQAIERGILKPSDSKTIYVDVPHEWELDVYTNPEITKKKNIDKRRAKKGQKPLYKDLNHLVTGDKNYKRILKRFMNTKTSIVKLAALDGFSNSLYSTVKYGIQNTPYRKLGILDDKGLNDEIIVGLRNEDKALFGKVGKFIKGLDDEGLARATVDIQATKDFHSYNARRARQRLDRYVKTGQTTKSKDYVVGDPHIPSSAWDEERKNLLKLLDLLASFVYNLKIVKKMGLDVFRYPEMNSSQRRRFEKAFILGGTDSKLSSNKRTRVINTLNKKTGIPTRIKREIPEGHLRNLLLKRKIAVSSIDYAKLPEDVKEAVREQLAITAMLKLKGNDDKKSVNALNKRILGLKNDTLKPPTLQTYMNEDKGAKFNVLRVIPQEELLKIVFGKEIGTDDFKQLPRDTRNTLVKLASDFNVKKLEKISPAFKAKQARERKAAEEWWSRRDKKRGWTKPPKGMIYDPKTGRFISDTPPPPPPPPPPSIGPGGELLNFPARRARGASNTSHRPKRKYIMYPGGNMQRIRKDRHTGKPTFPKGSSQRRRRVVIRKLTPQQQKIQRDRRFKQITHDARSKRRRKEWEGMWYDPQGRQIYWVNPATKRIEFHPSRGLPYPPPSIGPGGELRYFPSRKAKGSSEAKRSSKRGYIVRPDGSIVRRKRLPHLKDSLLSRRSKAIYEQSYHFINRRLRGLNHLYQMV